MKKIIYILTTVCATLLSAQVGIGTDTPQSTLDVRSTNGSDATNEGAYASGDGILIPRVNARPTVDGADDGELVYVNGDGFYYWNATGGTWDPVITPLGLSVNCFTNGLTGFILDGSESTLEYSITISNLGDTTTITLDASDITLTAGAGATINASTITPSVSELTIAQGGSALVTYSIAITATGAGNTITADLNTNNLTCSSSLQITDASSGTLATLTFGTAEAYTYGTEPVGGGALPRFTQDIGSTADEGLTVQIPYTGATTGSYVGYSGLLLEVDQDGSVSRGNGNRTLVLSYPAGEITTAGSGFIEATITSQDTAGVTVDSSVTDQNNGNATSNRTIGSWTPEFNGVASGTVSLINQSLIYGKQTLTSSVHNFYYDVVTDVNGEEWLNNNLGSEYNNQSSANFSPATQAQSQTDALASGSLFQWGRNADGHELVNYTSLAAVLGTIVESEIAYTASDQRTSYVAINNSDWRIADDSPTPYGGTNAGDDNFLWDSTSFDPCPNGFHVPTAEEFYDAVLGTGSWATDGGNLPAQTGTTGLVTDAAGISNGGAETAYDGSLRIVGTGKRDPVGGVVTAPDNVEYFYWVNTRIELSITGGPASLPTISDSQATALRMFLTTGVPLNRAIRVQNKPKTSGYPVRCKRD